MPAPISNEQAPLELSAVINEWQRLWHDDGFVAEVEHAAHCDDKGHYHWMIRLRGEEKNVIALWLTLRQRTVFFRDHGDARTRGEPRGACTSTCS